MDNHQANGRSISDQLPGYRAGSRHKDGGFRSLTIRREVNHGEARLLNLLIVRSALLPHSVACPPRIARPMDSSNSLPAKGLTRYATAFASSDRARAAGSSYPVMNMTGHGGCVGSQSVVQLEASHAGQMHVENETRRVGREPGLRATLLPRRTSLHRTPRHSAPTPAPGSCLHRPRQLSPAAVQTASVHLHGGPPRHARHKTCGDTPPSRAHGQLDLGEVRCP